MALRNPPGRAEKSINFLCCDHSVSDVKIDCCEEASIGYDAVHDVSLPGSNQEGPRNPPTEQGRIQRKYVFGV